MKMTAQIARVLAIVAGCGCLANVAHALARPEILSARFERQPAFAARSFQGRPAEPPLLVANLGPEQKRQIRQQMREQWQQSPPERREERRPDYRERWQQMTPDDRFRMREEMRENRGRGRRFDNGR